MTFTAEQQRAITARGNTLVLAGAGSGKTRTLVERCAQVLLAEEPAVDIRSILVATFNEAAAAEVRERLRKRLEGEDSERAASQLARLDLAQISTLHSFCLKLVREHFYELELDPAVSVLDDAQAQVLFLTTVEELLDEHYRGEHSFSHDLMDFFRNHTNGKAKPLIEFVRKVHSFTQTRPDPDLWFARQFEALAGEQCDRWTEWHRQAVNECCQEWLPWLKQLPTANQNAHDCAKLLEIAAREGDADVIAKILARDECWNGRKTKDRPAFKELFDEAAFLASVQPGRNGPEAPLQQDWSWSRGAMELLLRFARQFGERFSAAKRDRCVLDFHDLEQGALRLLWEGDRPSQIAEQWRRRFAAIFVDEYQDINAAQDKIIRAVSSDNRFLVGDNKQSIYRFRQADPAIFQRYLDDAEGWQQVFLSENFRSHEAILNFINPLFGWLMRQEIGGVQYDERAALRFGLAPGRDSMRASPDQPRVELHLIYSEAVKDDEEDRSGTEIEAGHVAVRLREMKESGLEIEVGTGRRAVRWGDMVVLLRSAANKLEIYAKAFEAAGVPLHTKQTSFYTTQEVLDLFSLLNILDNPWQDIPLVAVLRSPLCGMTASDLAEIRVASHARPFWRALCEFHELKPRSEAGRKAAAFLDQYHRWREGHSSASLSRRLERILEETGYDQWLLTQPRGPQRFANVQQLLRIARQFDQARGESLYQFILHVEELQEAVGDIEPASAVREDAVRLMTVHQSKGLEFPVVAAPDLGKRFNKRDGQSDLLIDDEFGLCAMVQPPAASGRYPSLPLWRARRKQWIETLGEEIRLMYVAFTRAQNRLLLFGSTKKSGASEKSWSQCAFAKPLPQHIARAGCWLDWIGAWLTTEKPDWLASERGEQAAIRYQIHRSAPEFSEAAPEERAAECVDSAGILKRIDFHYGYPEATREAAKASVSALRRKFETKDEDARTVVFGRGKSDGRERGLATHTFLEHLDLDAPLDIAGLENQAARLVRTGILAENERAWLDLESLAFFWASDLGREIVAVRSRVKRELPFSCKLTRELLLKHGLGGTVAPPTGEFVVLQGIVDLAMLGPEQIWLLDFKTEQTRAAEIPRAVESYRIQLGCYALALETIYRRPVTRRGLYFLGARELILL